MRYFRFQLLNAPVAQGQCRSNICSFKTLGDMLRTIGVPGGNLKQHNLLRPRPVILRHELCQQFHITFNNAGLTPDFNPPPVGIVNEKQIGLGIFREIAKCDVLFIAREIRKTDGLVV